MDIIDEELKARCGAADEINLGNLLTVIRDNKDTEYGKKYGFEDIKRVEDYRSRVPLTDYSDYEESIARMRNGEKNVLTVYSPETYCCTSGTTGASKYIPVSRTALERYSDYCERCKNKLIREKHGRRFLINSFRTDIDKPPSELSLITEAYYRYLYESGLMSAETYVGGKDMIFVRGEDDIMYAKVWEAFASPDIVLFEAVFMYEILGFFSYIEENWRVMLRDLKAHNIPGNISLSEKVREYLLSLKLTERRLEEIEHECSAGFGGIAVRLWKRLELASGIGNRRYLTEEAALKRYLGGVKCYYQFYCASECLLGMPVRLDDFDYVLFPDNAFFEFIRCDGKSERLYLPHELEVGALYEPVITNFSGLYRYRMGDVVRIKGFEGKSPIMEFMYRKGQALNIAGEKYDINQLERAVYDLRNDGMIVDNYCFGASLETIPGKYIAVMSLEKGSGPDGLTEDMLAEHLDRSLCRNSNDYADLRGLGQLDMPRVLLCGINEYAGFAADVGLNRKHGHNKAKHIFKQEVSERKWTAIIHKAR